MFTQKILLADGLHELLHSEHRMYLLVERLNDATLHYASCLFELLTTKPIPDYRIGNFQLLVHFFICLHGLIDHNFGDVVDVLFEGLLLLLAIQHPVTYLSLFLETFGTFYLLWRFLGGLLGG